MRASGLRLQAELHKTPLTQFATACVMVACVPQAPVRLRRRRPPHRPRRPGLRRRRAPTAPTNAGHVKRAIDRLGLLQIDSVNVLARAHYLPLFSRLGNYDSDHLDRIAWGRKSQRGLFEFWAHEASLLPLASASAVALAHAARRASNAGDGKGKLHRLPPARRRHSSTRCGARSPTAGRSPPRTSSQRRRTARRLVGLERRQAAPRMAVLRRPGHHGDAARHLRAGLRPHRARAAGRRAGAADAVEPRRRSASCCAWSAEALGVATEFDLRDYFRLGVADTKARLAELVEAGDLLPVAVEGWDRPAYLDPAARQPRSVEARALLAPFDPLIWERDRTASHLRLPLPHRASTRRSPSARTATTCCPSCWATGWWRASTSRPTAPTRKLLVHAAHLEEGQDAAEVAGPLREELRLMADWLGLESVSLPCAGALAKAMGRMR